jgi:hypothetical protein
MWMMVNLMFAGDVGSAVPVVAPTTKHTGPSTDAGKLFVSAIFL